MIHIHQIPACLRANPPVLSMHSRDAACSSRKGLPKSSRDRLLQKILRMVHSEIGKPCARKSGKHPRKRAEKKPRYAVGTSTQRKSAAIKKGVAKRKPRYAVGADASKKPAAKKRTQKRHASHGAEKKLLGKKDAERDETGSCKRASKVYVLQLEGGYVYVGKTSRTVQQRLREHMGTSGRPGFFSGAAFTRLHKPTGKILKRLGNLEGDGDGPERDETLRQMHKRGAQKVRGWKYVKPGPLGKEDLEDIEKNIREMLDLCRRCGKKGHFTLQCRKCIQ